MADYIEFSAKTKSDAITEACQKLSVTSDRLDYVVVDEGSAGFLGIGSKPVIIKARVKEDAVSEVEDVKTILKENKPEYKNNRNNKRDNRENKSNRENNANKASDEKNEKPSESKRRERSQIKILSEEEAKTAGEEAKKFLTDVFSAMGMSVNVATSYNFNDGNLNIELSGDDMGVLIGKRGQTLDSLQYLSSLVVNKGTAEYIRVKVDTEDYRSRRRETLENLAKNIAYKVKRTRRSVSLEPMNPYERRIIHSALQNDQYVSTHSEGDEPYRRVVVTLKNGGGRYNRSRNYNNNR
ncbi:MAG: protein jag [Lachnospiraceae bacterium]|nr:protein jag [Lachnospiraceae bacterium]